MDLHCVVGTGGLLQCPLGCQPKVDPCPWGPQGESHDSSPPLASQPPPRAPRDHSEHRLRRKEGLVHRVGVQVGALRQHSSSCPWGGTKVAGRTWESSWSHWEDPRAPHTLSTLPPPKKLHLTVSGQPHHCFPLTLRFGFWCWGLNPGGLLH